MHLFHAMNTRQHMHLRAIAVLLLAIVALWPKSRGAHHDLSVAPHAIRGEFTTAAARPSAEQDLPRPRNVRIDIEDLDESQLKN